MSIDVRAGAAGTSRIRYIYTVYVTKSTVILKNSLIGIAVSYAEKATSPHSSPLARKIPWTEEPGGPQSTGSHRVGHDRATGLPLFPFTPRRRKWEPTAVFLPGEPQGRGCPAGYRLRGRTDSDTMEATEQWRRRRRRRRRQQQQQQQQQHYRIRKLP